jgi:hypothetical protein
VKATTEKSPYKNGVSQKVTTPKKVLPVVISSIHKISDGANFLGVHTILKQLSEFKFTMISLWSCFPISKVFYVWLINQRVCNILSFYLLESTNLSNSVHVENPLLIGTSQFDV